MPLHELGFFTGVPVIEVKFLLINEAEMRRAQTFNMSDFIEREVILRKLA